MTTDEKLLRFSQDAIMMATKKSDEELTEYEKNLDNLYESHTRSVRRQATARLKLTRESLLRERNRLLSMERLEAKHAISIAEAEHKDALFQKVKAMLSDYKKTPAYAEDLLALIDKAASQLGTTDICAFLDESDAELIPVLAKKTTVALQTTIEPIFGGIIAMPKDGNVLVDLSYALGLQKEYDNLNQGGEIDV